MKNLLLITFILLSGLCTFAQETEIDKTEFGKAMYGNQQALMNKSYRTIEESEREGPFGSSKTKIITERVGSALRSIYESDSLTSYTKVEGIYINGRRFTKKLNNPWIEEKVEIVSPPPSNNSEIVSDESSYKLIGDGVLNDKKVKIYKVISSRIFVQKEKENMFITNDTTTYYFDETGLMIKSESVAESINKPKTEAGSAVVPKETKAITKKIKTVELDSNIKIEVPQIG